MEIINDLNNNSTNNNPLPILDKSSEILVATPAKTKISPNQFRLHKKTFLTISLLILLIVVSIVLFNYITGLYKEIATPVSSTPVPHVQSTPSTSKIPSNISTSSAFLKIEEQVKSLEQELNSVDLKESKLSFPAIEQTIKLE
ncbi:MAG: hypothetical protein V1858_01900 [Candidatus Gottesmanbacteria bacterium]